MSVVVLVSRVQEAPRLVHWTALIGRSRGEDVCVLHASGAGDNVPAALRTTAHRARNVLGAVKHESGGKDEELEVHVVPLPAELPFEGLLAELRSQKATLLVIGRAQKGDTESAEFELCQRLFHGAPCHTLMIRPGSDPDEKAEHVLVPTSGEPGTGLALEVAGDLAAAADGDVLALMVQTELGVDAKAVAAKALDRLVSRAPSRVRDRIRTKVALAESVEEGIAKEAADYDLVLLGTSSPLFLRRALFRTVPETALAGPEGTSVAVVRRAIPLTRRLEQALLRRVKGTVPQMGRSERVALVDKLRTSSQWNFDFVFLTGLSTLIAALGLLADNAPVVIGAMLIAPLMTPLIGGGLALVHGNRVFLRQTLATVGGGFLLALGVGALVGLLPGSSITEAMRSRGSPGAVDLTVAFASGMAAAYAIGRPGLTAALPGVAIAASLVPPIAAAGLALVRGDFHLTAGAALLFFTNLVAIVLGSALSLYATGIRSEHLHGRQTTWVRRATVALFVVAAIVVIPLGFWLAALR